MQGGSLQVIVGGDSEDRIVFDPAVPGRGRPWPVNGTGRGQGTSVTCPGRVPGGPHPGLATPSYIFVRSTRNSTVYEFVTIPYKKCTLLTRIGLYTQGFEPGEDPSDIEDPN